MVTGIVYKNEYTVQHVILSETHAVIVWQPHLGYIGDVCEMLGCH